VGRHDVRGAPGPGGPGGRGTRCWDGR
jgi:hypothetical protein